MNTVVAYLVLGFRHLVGITAADHLLFLLALVAPYRFRDWRRLLLVASAFTVGHSITLALAVGRVVTVPTELIEFLIPVTIAVTAARNLSAGGRPRGSAAVAGLFGLIHGAGFANYLTALFDGPIALPLLGFNLGVEIGQALILIGYLTAFALLARVAPARLTRPALARPALVSAAAGVGGLVMAAARLPR